MHIAAHNGFSKVVKALCRLGATMDVDSKFGTPAELAASEGHVTTVAKLAKYASSCALYRESGTKIRLFQCSQCLSVYYCSPECQKQDWKKHKPECKKKKEENEEETAAT